MIPEETINRAIRHAINGITGIDEFAIRGNQYAMVRPNDSEQPFASVTLILDETTGSPYAAYNNGYRTESYQTVSYSLSFFRQGAYDFARKVARGFYRDDIRTAFNSVGLGMKIPGSVRSITEALEEGWEERAQFDMDFDYVSINDASSDGSGETDCILSYEMNMLFNQQQQTITCGEHNGT